MTTLPDDTPDDLTKAKETDSAAVPTLGRAMPSPEETMPALAPESEVGTGVTPPR